MNGKIRGKQDNVRYKSMTASRTGLRRGTYGLIYAAVLLVLLHQWIKETVPDVTFDELLFHIRVPLKGTDTSLVVLFFERVLWSSIGIFSVIALLLFTAANCGKKMDQVIEKKPRIHSSINILTGPIRNHYRLILACVLVLEFHTISEQVSMRQYIANQLQTSTWIDEHYVDPNQTELTWPEKKRNLIYIYLESMEQTFMSFEDGGCYENDYIPELTRLARENVNFSDQATQLGGAMAINGTTWTMGAMFAQTSGLPLKMVVEGNSMDQYETFYPGVVTLGELTEKAGYRNIFMLGSDATFGGRRNYFTQHGNYEIYDYIWARENGKIPSDYLVFWGFEDERLIEMAKEKLLEVSADDQPFNFTMLTVDTHFPDGYRCDLCEEQWGNDYKDALSCSSRQIAQFIEWIQQQDFYEDTTIVITGDHLSMAAEIAEEIEDENYRRVYNCFINSAVEPVESHERQFLTIDMLPTTLAAMGVQIEGDRLALGTNLFSDKKTWVEEEGYETVEDGISRHSRFYDKLTY